MTYGQMITISDWQERLTAFRKEWEFIADVDGLLTNANEDHVSAALNCLAGGVKKHEDSLPALFARLLWQVQKRIHATESDSPLDSGTFVNRLKQIADRLVEEAEDDPAFQKTIASAFLRLAERVASRESELRDSFVELWKVWAAKSQGAQLDDDHRKLLDRLDHSIVGHSRILFPVLGKSVGTQLGSLVVADITVVELDADRQALHRLVLAPWSFFLLHDPEGHFAQLQTDLVCGLKKSIPGHDTVFDRMGFVVDVLPLMADQLDNDGADGTAEIQKASATWPLCPSVFKIEGPSLGLAVGIAAWAAALRKSVRPVVATGTLDYQGKIGRVQGVPEKVRAAQCLANMSRGKVLIAVPNDNRDEAIAAGVPENDVPVIRSLSDLTSEESRYLTDGFDSWRERLGLPFNLNAEAFESRTTLLVSESETEGLSPNDVDGVNKEVFSKVVFSRDGERRRILLRYFSSSAARCGHKDTP